jgi:hypothetical protein
MGSSGATSIHTWASSGAGHTSSKNWFLRRAIQYWLGKNSK